MVGCYELPNLYDRVITEGFDVHVGKLTGQEITKKVEFGLMSIHGPGMFLFKWVKEVVHKGVLVVQP